MDARLRFKEGWIMLLRPFKFAELKEPLQKLTILYAFSEKPIINLMLTEKGKKLVGNALAAYDGLNKRHSLSKGFNENDDIYEERFGKAFDELIRINSTVEDYKGEIVQCYVQNQMCRFYPEEYTVISRETFEEVLIAEEYTMDIETVSYFKEKNIADKLHYIRSRGIDKTLAERMSAIEARDSVIFRPRIELLQLFCRENEIY